MIEKDKLIGKQYGRNLVVMIKGVKYSKKTKDDKELKSIVIKIEMFNKKPSKERLEEIINIFSKTKVQEEKSKMEIKGTEKVIKKTKKEGIIGDKSAISERKKKNSKIIEKIKAFYSKGKKKDDVSEMLLINKQGYLAMKGCENIDIPDLLASRIEEFVTKQQEIICLLNFWSLCLLNPNEIARTKLFEYLQSNGLTITPSGYFVTFRMVKTTKENNIYTDAHTKTMKYTPGTVCSIPREECDEDGAKDCSKGLHTGTPLFIGIKASKKVTGDTKGILGDGYEITTKTKDHKSYGTGYDNPKEEKFDNSFGNQAILCLINPAHVVSIPDSNTRKMRSCEFYFAKLTTAEEVIDMVEKDYLIYDGDYNNFELKQLQEMLKNKTLKAYVDEKTKTGARIAKLEKDLQNKRDSLKLSSDKVNINLDLNSLKSIISQRIKTIK